MSRTSAWFAVASVCYVLIGLSAATAVRAEPPGDDRTRAKMVFDGARRAVNALPEAPYIAFTLQNDTHTDESAQEEKLRLLVRTSDGAAVVVALQNVDGSAVAHPAVRLVLGPSYAPLSYIARLGDIPLYDFGLRYPLPKRPGPFDAAGTPEPAATPEVTIAVVQVFNPVYRIDDLGDETLGGRAVYHLGLTPLRDAAHHVLREVWIDKTTMLPLQYVAQLPVNYLGSGNVMTHSVTIVPEMIDGHLVNTRVEGRFSVQVSEVLMQGQVQWTISQVSFPPDEPAWVFDVTQWAAHVGEPIPNLAP